MHPAVAPTNPPPAVWRWAVLVAISIAMFGNYYVYDSIGPVAESLQRHLGFTDTQIGTLNAIYSFPNIAMVLVGGVIVDRFGTRLSTLAFALVCLAGAIVTALSPLFPVMAAGRLIFGLGAESMIVAVTVAIGQWFVGRQLGFAFGVNLSIARAGSYSADLSTSWFKGLYDAGWQPPLVFAAAMSAVGVVGCILYYGLDRYLAPRYDVPRPAPSDRFVWSDLWRFDRSFWYVILLCVTFYSVIFPFRSTFAIKYFQHAHGLSLQDAGALNGYVFLAAIFATPAFGFMADMLGRRAAFMAFGCFLLAAVFPILAYTQMSLWVTTVMIGIAFSLVPAVIWPAVPYLVEPSRLGTAYGLMTMVQAIGLTAINLVAGALNDANGAGADNPAGYTPMLWMFMILSLLGFVFAYALHAREVGPQGHGLESIKAGAPLTTPGL
jgi:MFS family permease